MRKVEEDEEDEEDEGDEEVSGGVSRILEEVGNIGSYRNEWGVCSNL